MGFLNHGSALDRSCHQPGADQLSAADIRGLLRPELQRPGNRQNLSGAKSRSLRRGPDEAKLEM